MSDNGLQAKDSAKISKKEQLLAEGSKPSHILQVEPTHLSQFSRFLLSERQLRIGYAAPPAYLTFSTLHTYFCYFFESNN